MVSHDGTEGYSAAGNPGLDLVQRIHATPTLAVLAVTGGGGAALSDLLAVPGASRTVLELRVPYAASALADLLGVEPAQAVSAVTAAAMAGACHRRAVTLAPRGPGSTAEAPGPLVGVACTAALASDRPKRGAHRAHVALHDGARTGTWTLGLAKGARSRAEEDRLVADLVLWVLAEGCGLAAPPPVLGPGDHLGGPASADRRR